MSDTAVSDRTLVVSDLVPDPSGGLPDSPPGGISGPYSSPFGSRRFYKSPMWKHLVTTRDSAGVTDLSRLASDRSLRFELGAPWTLEGSVPSDDFRVYFPWADEFAKAVFDPFHYPDPFNMPRLSEGVRLIYSFRREGIGAVDYFDGASTVPWKIRHAGLVLQLTDSADPSARTTRFVALDPWQYLYRRPVRVTKAGDPSVNNIPPEMGAAFPGGTTGDAMITELLRRTIEEDGPCMIDAGVSFGGTTFYSGQIDTTKTFLRQVTFPRGMSVGEAWAQIADSGDLDIFLRPIYDPINRPGYLAELNIVKGTDNSGFFDQQPNFRWDRTGRNIVNIERGYDGEGRANKLRAYSGGTGAQSNPWTGRAATQSGKVDGTGSGDPEASWTSNQSVTRYGDYWLQQTYVRQLTDQQTLIQARREVQRRRDGIQTLRVSPTPEFSPRPFLDYIPGSYLSFYHSAKLRQEQWWLKRFGHPDEVYPRVYGFTVQLSDDSLETVTDMDLDIESGRTASRFDLE